MRDLGGGEMGFFLFDHKPKHLSRPKGKEKKKGTMPSKEDHVRELVISPYRPLRLVVS